MIDIITQSNETSYQGYSSNLICKFNQLFNGRTDRVALKDNYSTSVNNETEFLHHMENHLKGVYRVGIHNLLPDVTVQLVMVEFDDHTRPGDLRNTFELATQFSRHMQSVGIPVYIERSKNPNGNCYHCWIFFDKPISAKKLRFAFLSFLSSVLQVEAEVFPKDINSYENGNFVWLPLFGGSDDLGKGVQEHRTVFIDSDNNGLDPQTLLPEIIHGTEDMFNRLIGEYNLDCEEPRSRRKQKNLISGLDKVRKCKFMKHCEENASTLSESLWYAWITNAARCEGGRGYIHEFSSKHPKYDPILTDKKIAEALKETGPIKHEKIQELGFFCDCPSRIKAPISRATAFDIPQELERIRTITNNEDRLTAVNNLLSYWGRLDTLDREYFRPLIKSQLNIRDKVLKQYIESFSIEDIDYSEELKTIVSDCIEAKVTNEEIGEIVYEWLLSRKTRFFRDKDDNHYIFFNVQLLEIGSNATFEAWLYRMTGLTVVTNITRVIIKILKHLTQLEGKRIDSDTWLYTNLKKKNIYFHLNNDQQTLVKMGTEGVEVIKNGSNDDQVLLMPSMKIKPIQFKRLTDDEYHDALQQYKRLVVDNLACPEPQKIMCSVWVPAGLLFDFVKITPALRMEGDSAGGKSTAMTLISYPLYGDDQKKISTIASNYADGAKNPLVLLDNIETKNMSQELSDFIITTVTGIVKEKRQTGTHHGVIQERTRCLVCTTGIENLLLNEIINRSYIIEFDKFQYGGQFSENVFGEILEKRDEIMSALFILTSRILKRIDEGEWGKVKEMLDKRYGRHSKERTNSYLAIMVMITHELLDSWGDKRDILTLVDDWVSYQDRLADQTQTGTNVVLQFLDLLKKDVERMPTWGGNNTWQYNVKYEVIESDIMFSGVAADFHATFKSLAKQKGFKYDYKSSHQLSKRIRDGNNVLRDAGWVVKFAQGTGHRIHYSFVSSRIPDSHQVFETWGDAGNSPATPSLSIHPEYGHSSLESNDSCDSVGIR